MFPDFRENVVQKAGRYQAAGYHYQVTLFLLFQDDAGRDIGAGFGRKNSNVIFQRCAMAVLMYIRAVKISIMHEAYHVILTHISSLAWQRSQGVS